eukprot:3172233-Pleurochrysis_carterae.AAC.1
MHQSACLCVPTSKQAKTHRFPRCLPCTGAFTTLQTLWPAFRGCSAAVRLRALFNACTRA